MSARLEEVVLRLDGERFAFDARVDVDGEEIEIAPVPDKIATKAVGETVEISCRSAPSGRYVWAGADLGDAKAVRFADPLGEVVAA